MVGRGGLRGRARKHIDMGKRYENGIQRSALSPKANYPLPFSRIALLIIWRNILLQALCNITRNYFGPIDLDRFRSSRTFAILKVILIRSFKLSEIDSYDLKLSRWSLECHTALIFNIRIYHVPWENSVISFPLWRYANAKTTCNWNLPIWDNRIVFTTVCSFSMRSKADGYSSSTLLGVRRTYREWFNGKKMG